MNTDRLWQLSNGIKNYCLESPVPAIVLASGAITASISGALGRHPVTRARRLPFLNGLAVSSIAINVVTDTSGHSGACSPWEAKDSQGSIHASSHSDDR